eukprot:1694971-Lingulodinium_polyedra.AAC.1
MDRIAGGAGEAKSSGVSELPGSPSARRGGVAVNKVRRGRVLTVDPASNAECRLLHSDRPLLEQVYRTAGLNPRGGAPRRALGRAPRSCAGPCWLTATATTPGLL